MENKEKAKIVVISIVCSVFFSILIVFLMSGNAGTLSIKDFNVSELEFNQEELYSGSDTITYRGEAKITCNDKQGTYLLIYSKKLISGGTYEKIGEEDYETVIVHGGEGTITTYDIGDSNELIEPIYEIKLLGYRSFY